MTLSDAQVRHAARLQTRISDAQDELARFLSYCLESGGGDPSGQYILLGKELVDKSTLTPVKIQ